MDSLTVRSTAGAGDYGGDEEADRPAHEAMSAALNCCGRLRGDRDACEQAVLENNGLIWSVVRRYYGRGVEPDDLYQLGCLGFLKAVKGSISPTEPAFSTYAVPQNCRRDPAFSPG